MTKNWERGIAIDVHRLRILAAVVDCGSLTAAARTLGVTPSAVSQQLAALEREVGADVVERTSTGIVATAAGESLAARARQILDLLEEARADLSTAPGGVSGRVAVSAVASAAAGFVSAAVRELADRHPHLRVAVQTSEPVDSLAAVAAGRVEVAVVDEYDHVPLALPEDLQATELCTDRLVAVGPIGRFGDRPVRLAALRDERWVMPPVTAACGQAVRTACRSAGFEPDVRWESDDMLALELAIVDGHGVAVLPRLAVRAVTGRIETTALQRPALRRRLLVVVRRSAAARPSVRAVLGSLAAHAR